MPTTQLQHQILSADQSRQKIRRMAYQIYEQNYAEASLALAGVAGNGYRLAELLQAEIEAIAPITTELWQVRVHKPAPLEAEITLNGDAARLQGKTVILVDDVLNSGKTLVYALKPFLTIAIKRLQTAVLVDRDHKLFPIAADYTGYALSTTIGEHIEVVLDGERAGVYLN